MEGINDFANGDSSENLDETCAFMGRRPTETGPIEIGDSTNQWPQPPVHMGDYPLEFDRGPVSRVGKHRTTVEIQSGQHQYSSVMRLYQTSEQRLGRMGTWGKGELLKIGDWSPSLLSLGDVALLKQRPVFGDHQ